jgi:hypothetical protein
MKQKQKKIVENFYYKGYECLLFLATHEYDLFDVNPGGEGIKLGKTILKTPEDCREYIDNLLKQKQL